MADKPLPPCGLYRTARAIAGVPAGRLVFFHNHGDPGPGLYLPVSWRHNRAEFAERGNTVVPDDVPGSLEPLREEGFYRVREPFYCCEKRCREFEAEALVQLGYNGAGESILFAPEWENGALVVPDRGSLVREECLDKLVLLKVARAEEPSDRRTPPDSLLH